MSIAAVVGTRGCFERIVRVCERVALSTVPRCYGRLDFEDDRDGVDNCLWVRWGSQEECDRASWWHEVSFHPCSEVQL